LRDGPGLFSLRPENIRLAGGTGGGRRYAFAPRFLRQAFHGATELLQVQCADGLVLSLRAASRENWSGDVELEFSRPDAVPVRASEMRPPQERTLMCGATLLSDAFELDFLCSPVPYRAAITVPPLRG